MKQIMDLNNDSQIVDDGHCCVLAAPFCNYKYSRAGGLVAGYVYLASIWRYRTEVLPATLDQKVANRELLYYRAL